MSDDISARLKRLQEPFSETDIEWRVLQSMPWGSYIRCLVYPYVTARAIHQRLDDVVGPENWANTQQSVTAVDHQKSGSPVLSIQVGIMIRCNGEWITKYNVSEPTDIEAAKGGFSGAEKRAGEEWGIGRYLWYLGELDAKTTKTDPGRGTGWFYARLSEKHGGDTYWWQPPKLPSWALPPGGDSPKEEAPVTAEQLNNLKRLWVAKFAANERSRSEKVSAFNWFCQSLFGSFPIDTPSGWTQDMMERAIAKVKENAGGGSPANVPFD